MGVSKALLFVLGLMLIFAIAEGSRKGHGGGRRCGSVGRCRGNSYCQGYGRWAKCGCRHGYYWYRGWCKRDPCRNCHGRYRCVYRYGSRRCVRRGHYNQG